MPYKNSDNRRKWQRDRRREYTKRLRQLKKNHKKCDYCEYSIHTEVLEFHHRSPKEKSFSFTCGGFGNYSWKRILEEIAKCDIICANCHRYLHFKDKGFFIEKGYKGINNH